MTGRAGGGGISLPTLEPWMWRVLGGLLALYVAELLAQAAGVPIYDLGWASGAWLTAPWQPFTRLLVQGPNAGNVLFQLIGLYFFLPVLWYTLPEAQIREYLGGVWLGATLLPAVFDLIGLGGGYTFGWSFFLVAIVALYGLSNPDGQVYAYFVLPIPAVWFLWGTLLFGVLNLLAAFGSSAGLMGPFEYLGAWAGSYAWWHYRGPGRRRAPPKKKEAPKRPSFEVLDGGRSNRDDEVWH
jgi:hypothetical protein